VSFVSRRERAIVAGGAAVALLLGGHLLVVEPLLRRARAVEATVPVREAALERRRMLVAERPRLVEELAAATARLEAESARLLRGPTPPLAAAELQKTIRGVLPPGTVEVRSERVLPPAGLDELQEIGVELALVGGVRETVAALARLEGADRLLVIRDVRIRVMAAGPPGGLLTTVIVSGFLRTGPASSRSPGVPRDTSRPDRSAEG
jgi:Type II secretion system (T2SS), protein M subtype b